MIQDHTPVPIDKFNGLYGIDQYEDSVPAGYFIDELNTITYGDEVRTRDGFGLAHDSGAVTQFAVYRRQGEAARILVLVGNSIIDLTTGVTILTVSGMTGFAVGYSNNRAFISPHNGVSGLAGEFTYIYNGTGTARKAAGLSPVAGFNATVSATSGVIEAGTHLFAWVFETNSGFTTGPSAAQVVVFDGTKAVDFTNIPVGPAGTAARRLIASRAIQTYNGNEEGYEMFFVAGGRIDNNVDTVLAGVDFYDADLQFSADYVYDQLPEIPAVVFIVPYGNRLAFGGPNADKNLVYISKQLEPESIHSTAGFVSLDPFETEGVKDATEFRDNLYVVKKNKTYTLRDNGYEPSTWKPVTLDGAIGGDINSIARFMDSSGSRVEFFTVSSASGLHKFSGIYEAPAVSRNIKNWWDRINLAQIHKCQTVIDQERMRIYILVPLDGSSETNYIIVGNFENGFSFERIRWHLWNFDDFSPSSIGVDRDSTTKRTTLKVGTLSGDIYKQEDGRRNDFDTYIPSHIKFAFVAASPNCITHVGAIGLRLKGSGTLHMELWGQDTVDYQELQDITLATNPGKERMALAHFQSEKASLKISINNINDWFSINRINVYANQIFASRPLL